MSHQGRGEYVDIEILTVAVYPRIGGMTTWIDQIARGLAGLGWRVRLVGISDRWSDEYDDAPFDAVHIRMPSPMRGILEPADKIWRWKRAVQSLRRWSSQNAVPKLRLSDSTPGILHATSQLANRDHAPWAVLAGGDVFAETAHSPFAFYLHRRILRDLRMAKRVFVDGPDLVRSLSTHGVPEDHLIVQYHGVDLSNRPSSPLEPSFFPKMRGGLRLVWHGKHSDTGGPLRFIEIASKAPGTIARLAGEGPQSPEVRSCLQSRGCGEWWMGPLPPQQVPRFLAEGEVGVYPLKDMAGIPRVLLESMAAGLMTIAYPVGSSAELIEDGTNGFLCQNEDEVLSLIRRACCEPDLIQKLGEAARSTIARKWSMEATTRDLARNLEEVSSP
jgi:glycosyltransferase involved in cell wall biosynthesis